MNKARILNGSIPSAPTIPSLITSPLIAPETRRTSTASSGPVMKLRGKWPLFIGAGWEEVIRAHRKALKGRVRAPAGRGILVGKITMISERAG